MYFNYLSIVVVQKLYLPVTFDKTLLMIHSTIKMKKILMILSTEEMIFTLVLVGSKMDLSVDRIFDPCEMEMISIPPNGRQNYLLLIARSIYSLNDINSY